MCISKLRNHISFCIIYMHLDSLISLLPMHYAVQIISLVYCRDHKCLFIRKKIKFSNLSNLFRRSILLMSLSLRLDLVKPVFYCNLHSNVARYLDI